MEPVSIALATVGWLMSTLVNKATTALFEAWAKRVGLDKKVKALKTELTSINATLQTAHRYNTENSALLDFLKDLQQLAYQADDLLDELDYYSIKDHVELNGGNPSSQIAESTGPSSSSSSGFRCTSRAIHVASTSLCYRIKDNIELNGDNSSSQIVDSTGPSFSSSSGFKCASRAIHSAFKHATSIPFGVTMSRRMNELVEELQKTGENVHKALICDAAVPYNRVNLDNQATVINRRVTTSYPPQKVYGRDQERDNLFKLLIGDEAASQTLSVTAIVGHGGVGKTTLAQLVYNDEKMITFELKMWITVSLNFDVERLTQEILGGVSCSNCESITNLDSLQKTLEERLKEKKFLLVLDDLWEDKDASHWELLLAPLRNGSTKGNVVLITTRKPTIANLDHTINTISLDGLEENDYWSLFEACTFGNEMHVPQNLENIGREIVRKLKGNPLATKTVGALLKRNLDANYWTRVLEMEKWKHQNGAHDIMPALRISYDYLPFHLQRCFSYCALFPKNYKFKKQELVNIWSAQSFLCDRDKRMEEVGEEYLEDLVDFGFFEKKNYFVDVFCIHDLLHDLVQMVSLEECLSVDGREVQAILTTTRHLSVLYISDNTEKELTKIEKDVKPEKLSTLMFFGQNHSLDLEAFKRFQSKLKDANGLRLLRLGTITDVEPLLSSLRNFTHLRYLQLYSNYACKTLPSVICQLYHLQVLNVREWKNLKELPISFNNLINLQYFIPSNENLFSSIAGVTKLARLQELPVFRVRKERNFAIKQLRGLKELVGELKIYNMENVESAEDAKGAGLIEKSFLNSLHLSWDHSENSDVEHNTDALVFEHLQPHRKLKQLTVTGYGGATSPTWLTSQSMLTYLLEYIRLDDCMAWEILPPFGQLPFLKRLELRHMPNAREIGPDLSGYGQHVPFQCLKEMSLKDMPKLAKWVWNDLPALSKLSIYKCPELDFQLPKLKTNLNEQFPHLVHLQISGCPKLHQLPPLPCKNEISRINIYNVGSFERFSFAFSKLSICNPSNPRAWDDIGFHNLGTISSLKVTSNRYSLSWKNLCSLAYLEKLSFKDSPILFSFPIQSLQLTSLKQLILKSCGITGEQLLQHVPALERLVFNNCRKLVSLNGLQSLAHLKYLDVKDCPGFVDAWISTSDIEFSMPLEGLWIDTATVLAMPIIKQLTSLRTLTLRGVADLTKEQEESLLLLTSLKALIFRTCPDLRHLPANLHQLPSIEMLYIIKCRNIQSKPENGLPKSLKDLHVILCGDDQVRKMFEEYPQLSPVT